MSTPAPPGPSGRLAWALRALLVLLLVLLALRSPSSHPESAWMADLTLVLAVVLATAGGRVPGLSSPLVGLGAGLLAASHALAVDTSASWSDLAGWSRLALAWCLGACLRSRGGEHAARRLARGAAVLGVLATLHGAWQVLVAHPRLAASLAELPPAWRTQLTDGRANSVFLLPGHLGAFLAAASVLALAWALDRRQSGRHGVAALAAACGAACVLGVALAGSFGGILLLGLGLAMLCVRRLRGPWRLALVVGGACVLVALGALSASRRAGELARESPLGARVENWASAARLVREAPVLGHGGGSFALEQSRVRSATSNDARHAHQAALEAGAEHGLGALVLLVLLAGRALRAAWDGAAVAGSEHLASGHLAAVAVVLGHGLLDFGWSDPTFAVPAALALGAVGRARGPARPGARLIVVACCAILLGETVTGSRVASLERGALELARAGDHGAALTLLERAVRVAPDDGQAWGLLAEAHLARRDGVEDVRSAVDAARRAVALSPRRALHRARLARAATAAARWQEAYVAAAEAVRLAPHDPQHRSALGVLEGRMP